MITTDLHMHSDISSDGEFSPIELMRLCKKEGLRCAALTDHDSVAGVAKAAAEARALGLDFLTGTELSCKVQGVPLHLLGYGFSLEKASGPMAEHERYVAENDGHTYEENVAWLRARGAHFDDAELDRRAEASPLPAEILCELLLCDPANASLSLLDDYRPGGRRSDNPYLNFYWDLFSPGKPGWVDTPLMAFEDALELIVSCGGRAVIAHPAATVGRNERLIRLMAACGVSGIEAYSTYHTEDDVKYFCALADELGLAKTAGSDFHGKTKPSVKLGRIPGGPDEDEVRHTAVSWIDLNTVE